MGYWLLKPSLSEVFGHAFEFGFDVAFGGAVDGFVEAGVFAEELPLGHLIVIGLDLPLYFHEFSVHFDAISTEVRFDSDGAAFVVDGGIGCGGGEGDAVAANPGTD